MAKVNTIFSFTDNVSNPIKRMNNNIKESSNALSGMAMKIIGVNQAIQLFNTAVGSVKKLYNQMEQLTAIYNIQAQAETKLTTIMRQRMGANDETIQSMKNLASELQKVGIYGDEMILNGMQELSTFADTAEAVKVLTPALTNLVAQQYGYSASAEQMRSSATMMGKVLGGQAGGLTRFGYVLTDAEKHIIETGTEMERANTIAKVITQSVGEMNKALAGTDAGAIMNATNSIGDMREELGKLLQPLQAGFIKIKNQIFAYFMEPMKKAITYVKNNMDSLIATIIQVGTITTIVGATMAVAWAVANWPITLAIALIATLIRMLYDTTVATNQASEAMTGFASACERAGRTFGQVVGFISATVGGLMNIIYNVIATVVNALYTVSEFILNIFTHPINAIARLFIDLASTILQVLSTVGGTLDFVFGTGISKTLNNADRQLQAFKEKQFGNVNYKYQRLGLKDVQGIVQGAEQGGKFGADIGRIIDQNLSFGANKFQTPQLKLPDLKTDGTGALLTTDKNLVDIADDYRDLLSQKALRNFDLKYSQVVPQVNFGDMVINNDIDIADIADVITEAVAESSSSSLRGN